MAIYRHTKYNPDVHSNIPSNYRFLWMQKTDRLLDLTDEDIFDIWKDEGLDCPEDMEQDDWIFELITEKLDSKNKDAI